MIVEGGLTPTALAAAASETTTAAAGFMPPSFDEPTLMQYTARFPATMSNPFCFVLAVLFIFSCEKKPPSDVTDPGQLLFLGFAKEEVNCARCHGPDGQGGTDAPALQNIFSKYRDDEILDIIDFGKGEGKEAMPAFGESLSEQELQHLLHFLRQLQHPPPDSE